MDQYLHSLGNGFDFEEFKDNFKIEIKSVESSLAESSCKFDVIGIDASIANTLRRIMLSRVYTMTIDSVTIGFLLFFLLLSPVSFISCRMQ